jgi:YidC/Oxa1 family membrane protein insertase
MIPCRNLSQLSMDRKSIVVIVLCFGLLGLWSYVLVPKLYPSRPLPPGATNSPPAAASFTNPPAMAAATPAAQAPAPISKPVVSNTNIEEQLIERTNGTAHYTFTSHGGGLKLIELLQYPETVSTLRHKRSRTNQVATLNQFSTVPTLALLGGDAVQGDGIFQITKTDGGVRAEKVLTNGLVIVKEFELSTNYLVLATVRLENRSHQPLALPSQEWIVGTATPMGPRDNGQAVGVLWYNGSKSEDVAGSTYFASGGCRQRVAPAVIEKGRHARSEGRRRVLREHRHWRQLAVIDRLRVRDGLPDERRASGPRRDRLADSGVYAGQQRVGSVAL